MLVLASSSNEFFLKWNEIIGQSDTVIHVYSISQLKDFLANNDVRLIILDMTLDHAKDPAILRSVSEIKKNARLILAGIQFLPIAELSGLAVGAVACCSSSLSVQECHKVLDVVQKGGVWLSSTGIPELINRLRDFSASASDHSAKISLSNAFLHEKKKNGEKDILAKLTKREREVAELVGSGASNKDIARELSISDRTVKAHLTAIFEKLEIKDRLSLALKMSARQK